MSMAYAPSAPATPASRQVRFAVIDQRHEPIEGVRLEFSFDGKAMGSVVTGPRGATLTVPRQIETIDVRATHGEKTLTATIATTELAYTFQFERSLFKSYEPSGARCPDGSTGNPCVDCVIDGRPIRICATA
jgi:hypothetical protein